MSSNEKLKNFYNKTKVEETAEPTGKKTFLKKEDKKKKQFSPKAPKELFRQLPIKEGQEPVEKAYYHEEFIGGMNTKIYCPKMNDGKKCALCEKSEEKKAKWNDKSIDEKTRKEWFKAGKKQEPKCFFIIKGVDPNAYGDGTKFWRFKEDTYKNDGVLDKLMPAIDSFIENFSTETETVEFDNVERGCNFEITTVEATIGGDPNKTYRAVSTIMPKKPSPLHSESEKIQEFLNCPLTWRDIFGPTELNGICTADEYIQLAAEGRAPFWSKKESAWMLTDENMNVYKHVFQKNNSQEQSNIPSAEVTMEDIKSASTMDDYSYDDVDDLPF